MGDPVAQGGVGVALQDNPGGKYCDLISDMVYLIKRIAAGNPAVIGGNGVEQIENQAGKSFIITVQEYILINTIASENTEIAVAPAVNMGLIPLAPGPVREGRQLRVPLSFLDQRAKWTDHDLGRMDIRCTGCKALHWGRESSASRRP